MPIPTLQTAQLLLRPFTLEDAPIVQQLAGAHEVASTTLNIPHPYEDGMAEDWISTHQAGWDTEESVTLAMTSEGDGVVGAITPPFSSCRRTRKAMPSTAACWASRRTIRPSSSPTASWPWSRTMPATTCCCLAWSLRPAPGFATTSAKKPKPLAP